MNGFDDIEFACQTDVGMRRSHNQDSHASLPATDQEQWQTRGHVFLVADGMGAHAVGELASKLAADSIPHIYSKHAQEGPIAALRKAFVEANLNIHNRGQANKEFEGMGTTATAIVVRPEGAWVGHVGDSRAYRIRDGVLEQLSFDHSLVWELARRQKKNPDELEGVPSNVIIRSLGPEPLVQVDVEGPHPLVAGDTFLLCSDGLSGPVPERHMGAVASVLPPHEACRFLIHLANSSGGPDNITAIVVRLVDKEAASRPDFGLEVPPKAKFLEKTMQWLSWMPSALTSLLLGIALAVGAIYLAYENIGGEIIVFLLSATFLLAGVLGLMLHTAKENKEAQPEFDERPLRIYRRTNCKIEGNLVQEIRQTLAAFEKRLQQGSTPFDSEAYRHLLQQAHQHLQQKRLSEAYRDYCRAILVILDTLGSEGSRGESFRPLWDTTGRN